MDSAELILLLVSPDFLASDYCYEIELKRALERHDAGTARVVPVILRPVDWHEAPFSKLQALPRDGKPIAKWSNRDDAYNSVVAGIKRVIPELRERNAGRIIDFQVSSYGKHDATIEWRITAITDIRLSLFHGAKGRIPRRTIPVPPSSTPGRQTFTIRNLRPGSTYRIVAQSDTDQQEIILKTLDEWMQ